MKISVRVIPRANKNEIKKQGDIYKIRVTAVPADGEANKKVIELLAEEFKTAKKNVKIVSGEKSRNKIVDIEKNL